MLANSMCELRLRLCIRHHFSIGFSGWVKDSSRSLGQTGAGHSQVRLPLIHPYDPRSVGAWMMGFERGAKEWDIGERRIISRALGRDGACAVYGRT